jgi:hypothetical protein
MVLQLSLCCAILLASVYVLFVHLFMSSVQASLGLPLFILASKFPFRRLNCKPSALVMCPKYCYFLLLKKCLIYTCMYNGMLCCIYLSQTTLKLKILSLVPI